MSSARYTRMIAPMTVMAWSFLNRDLNMCPMPTVFMSSGFFSGTFRQNTISLITNTTAMIRAQYLNPSR